MIKKIMYCLTGTFFLACLYLSYALVPAASAAPITLKCVTFLPVNDPVLVYYWKFTEWVKEKTNGEITIKGGGPEAIPSFQQMEALRNGVVDLLPTASAYHQGEMFEACTFQHSDLTPSEERKVGYTAYMDEMYRKNLNATYLGRFAAHSYKIFSKIPLRKIEDFKGVRIRISPVYEPFVKALGMITLSTTFAEVYSSMERGIVDCFAWPEVGPKFYGWHEVSKYVIEPQFYNSNAVILMNLNSWNKLSKNHQKAITDSILQMEKEMVPYFAKLHAEHKQFFMDYGLKYITVDEPERYIQISKDAAWEMIKTKSPVQKTIIEKMIRR